MLKKRGGEYELQNLLRKLPEYIENCMMYDMSEAMEKHMNDCKSVNKDLMRKRK